MKIIKYPGTHSSEKLNFAKHINLLTVNCILIFFTPSCLLITVQTKFCICAKLTDNKRCIKFRLPAKVFNFNNRMRIPTSIFVCTNYTKLFRKRIFYIYDFGCVCQLGCCRNQACLIKFSCFGYKSC